MNVRGGVKDRETVRKLKKCGHHYKECVEIFVSLMCGVCLYAHV